MEQKNKGHKRRLRSIVFSLVFIAIILSVATYAWFIGMRAVNVKAFDVKVAATDSLLLSLDGKIWSTAVNISEANFDSVNTLNNTNWWTGDKGLIPMSSIGNIDPAVSRLELYEKSSLTPTLGGYRLMASRVDNTGSLEIDGYVAFDLFIKNFSGTQYIGGPTPNILEEEAIYLAFDSAVTVSAAGVADTGIENSVRVAFAQIGRVKGTIDDQTTITGINCTGDATVTSICSRTAQIWEPNDQDHVESAVNWYNEACRVRTGLNIDREDPGYAPLGVLPYGAKYTCGAIDKEHPTYAIGTEIDSNHYVDIYDGFEFNSYIGNTYDADTNPNGKLTKMYAENGYFTDSMKIKAGTDRPEFMRLAPNSITKVRIYIWIEGQDIDNYDFAAIGKAITVNFGFTKERFDEDEAGYEGPEFRPEIVLEDGTTPGNPDVELTAGSAYVEPGFTLTDHIDGDPENGYLVDHEDSTLMDELEEAGAILEIYNPMPDPSNVKVGTYTIIYRYTNTIGVNRIVTRTVTVTAP